MIGRGTKGCGFGMIEFLDEDSPLDYSHLDAPPRVRRLALRDTEAPQAPAGYFPFFVPATVPTHDAPEIVARKAGRRKRVTIPGAGPGVVAFVDYHALPDGGIRLDYMSVRSDQRRRRLACKLVNKLYEKHGNVPYIDFGDVLHEAAWKLCLRKMAGSTQTRGQRWR